MLYGNSRRDGYPSLPWPGTIAASLLLILLTVLAVRFSVLSPLFTLLAGSVFAGILLLRRTPLALLAPIGAGLAAVLAAPSATAAILPVLFLPLGVVTAHAVRCGFDRMKAVAAAASASAAVGAAATAVILWAEGGSLASYAAAYKSRAILWLTSHTVLTDEGVRTAVLTEQSADVLISYGMLFTPAVLVCGLFLLAFGTTELLRRLLALLDAEADFLPDGWPLLPGRAAAVLYMISEGAVFLTAQIPDAEIPYYAFSNAALIFLTPLAILGITTLVRQFRHAEALGTLGRLALIFLTIMLAAAGLYWLLSFAAFYGIYLVFRSRRR